MPTIKNTADAPGGYFDPHTHYTGIVHYRVLAVLTEEGKTLVRRWRASDRAGALRHLTIGEIEEFLARHTLADATTTDPPVHLRPFHEDQPAKAKAGILYDLETRLLILQALGLAWGLADPDLPAGDLKRVRENAGTMVAILANGTGEVQKRFTGALAGRGKLLQARPDDMDALCDQIVALDIPQTSAKEYGEGLPKLVRHVCQNVLTATPQNDYDSAYVGRGLLKIGVQDLMDAGIRELARQNIVYSEQSLPLWSLTGKWAIPGIKESIDKAERSGVVVRWLPMLVGSFLGWVGDSHESPTEIVRTPEDGPATWSMLRLYDATGSDQPPRKAEPVTVTPWQPGERGAAMRCLAANLARPHDDWTLRWAEPAAMNWPVRAGVSLYDDFDGWLDKLDGALRGAVPHAVGFDIASPERTWYTAHGGRLLTRVLHRIFKIAKAGNIRLVAHVHVGEGYPGFVDNRAAAQNIAAQAKRSEQEPLRILYDGETHLPAHYLCAENNVQVMLNAVEALRLMLSKDDLALFDHYVRVRFGHVTHATLIQAQRMAEARIWADVNLTSNLATGALSFVTATAGHTAQQSNRTDLMKRAAELVNQQPNRDLFKHHALLTLLTSGVSTVLGTDGGGIEHSEIAREHALAAALLANARTAIDEELFTILSSAKAEKQIKLEPTDAQTLKDRLSPVSLYAAQAAHHAWMEGEDDPPLPIAPDAELDRQLANAFIEAVAGH
ncbi:hypothetical protein ACGFNU_34690 [Spirillospora sp. NPDC048911]|uniref:hypothetical protein n=1 Tax=Spirillospora sp. NPDC048911 TaxID=3364527 RepID=UPI003717BCAF